jgi:hypothetical protein
MPGTSGSVSRRAEQSARRAGRDVVGVLWRAIQRTREQRRVGDQERRGRRRHDVLVEDVVVIDRDAQVVRHVEYDTEEDVLRLFRVEVRIAREPGPYLRRAADADRARIGRAERRGIGVAARRVTNLRERDRLPRYNSTSDGARKPVPQPARSRTFCAGRKLIAIFGLVVLPKSE